MIKLYKVEKIKVSRKKSIRQNQNLLVQAWLNSANLTKYNSDLLTPLAKEFSEKVNTLAQLLEVIQQNIEVGPTINLKGYDFQINFQYIKPDIFEKLLIEKGFQFNSN